MLIRTNVATYITQCQMNRQIEESLHDNCFLKMATNGHFLSIGPAHQWCTHDTYFCQCSESMPQGEWLAYLCSISTQSQTFQGLMASAYWPCLQVPRGVLHHVLNIGCLPGMSRLCDVISVWFSSDLAVIGQKFDDLLQMYFVYCACINTSAN